MFHSDQGSFSHKFKQDIVYSNKHRFVGAFLFMMSFPLLLVWFTLIFHYFQLTGSWQIVDTSSNFLVRVSHSTSKGSTSASNSLFICFLVVCSCLQRQLILQPSSLIVSILFIITQSQPCVMLFASSFSSLHHLSIDQRLQPQTHRFLSLTSLHSPMAFQKACLFLSLTL